jgi:hypothetical protein
MVGNDFIGTTAWLGQERSNETLNWEWIYLTGSAKTWVPTSGTLHIDCRVPLGARVGAVALES